MAKAPIRRFIDGNVGGLGLEGERDHNLVDFRRKEARGEAQRPKRIRRDT